MIDAVDPMRCLFLHNFYQNPGGEDVSMFAEIDLLRNAGHHVKLMEWHNDSIHNLSAQDKLSLFWRTTWNPDSKKIVSQKLTDFNADLLHVQNFFPLISPSVHTAARGLDIPTVQHLRNFRLGCLNAYLYRNAQTCESCVGHNPWRGLIHRCYRNSLPASLGLWQMLTVHRWRLTWEKDIDAFITPSKFAAEKLLEIGLPADKMHVKPNFIPDPLQGNFLPPLPEIPTFIYIGRLSPEKGIQKLLQAWRIVNQNEWRLWIVGGGPMDNPLIEFCREHQLQNVKFWGQLSASETLSILQKASMLVVPSDWYETFGRVVIEAFACGRGVIVSDIGALRELVGSDGEIGFTVPYLETEAWAERIQWSGENFSVLQRLGKAARNRYLENYTPEINYLSLMKIYEAVAH